MNIYAAYVHHILLDIYRDPLNCLVCLTYINSHNYLHSHNYLNTLDLASIYTSHICAYV